MTLVIIQILAAIFFVASLSAGIWLFLHLSSLASALDGLADLAKAEARPRYSKARLAIAMAVLIGGAAACLLLAFLVVGAPLP